MGFAVMKRAQAILCTAKEVEDALGFPLDDARVSEEPTLSLETWASRARLLEDALESAPSPAAATLLMEQYHKVQRARCRLVPLTSAEWQRWVEAMGKAVANRTAAGVAGGGPGGETAVDAWAARFLTEMYDLHAENTWGSLATRKQQRAHLSALLAAAGETAAERFRLVHRQLSEDATVQGSGERLARREHRAVSVETLVGQAFESVLQLFARSAYEEEGEVSLAGEPTVEALLREHLLEPLLLAIEEVGEALAEEEEEEAEEEEGDRASGAGAAFIQQSTERMRAVVEGWLRQSFRREIAFAWHEDTTAILTAYDEFEVDKGKRESMRAFVKATRNPPFTQWQYASQALADHVDAHAGEPAIEGAIGVDAATTAKTKELVSRAMNVWESAAPVDGLSWTSSSPMFRCFHLQMRRLLDYQAFPGFFPRGFVERVLSSFHSWFGKYIACEHRWSLGQFPFTAVDDSDLWSFVLSRHTVLLQRSMAAAAAAASTTSTASSAGSSEGTPQKEEVLVVFEARWAHMRTLTLSALHLWQTYLSVLWGGESHANQEKKRMRAQHATYAVTRWFNGVLVQQFAKAYMNDLYDAAEARPFTYTEEAALLVTEAKLKMLISDVSLALGAAHSPVSRHRAMLEARRRLRSVTDAVHQFLLPEASAGEAQREGGDPFPSLLSTWGELLDRLRCTAAARNVCCPLPAVEEVAPSSANAAAAFDTAAGEEREALRYLVHQYKELARLCASRRLAVTTTNEALSKLQQLLLEYPVYPGRGVSGSEPEEAEGQVLPPCLPLYSDPKMLHKKGGRERIPLGGLMDLACEALAVSWMGEHKDGEAEALPSRKRSREGEE